MREITVSYSELMAARRCEFKHQLSYVEGWSKEHGPDSALTFGTAWHSVLNAYYTALKDGNYISNWEQKPSAWRAGKEAIEYQPEEIRPHLRWMLEGYSAHYGTESGWRVLATEQKLIVPLPQLNPNLKINLKVYIDLVIYDVKNCTLWVDDHKSAGQMPSQRQPTDPQLPLYMYALQHELDETQGDLYGTAYTEVFGARYSYALKPCKTLKFKKEPELEKRFVRRLRDHTKREVHSVARDAYLTIYNRYINQKRWGDRQPRSRQPDCNRCDFNLACAASLKGYRAREFLTDNGLSRWREDTKAPTEVEETNG